ncbi:hypothetical protein PAXRUDRAFT_282116 [Paxillus rubicundulus Ve08.2h10]|uniref:Uncharacterized protein n=1 Tax=Paxillus rubicundulus Ve08.2h10 TaxID=930991 RepID=A0A0D0EAM9_9AGAM|nr:hypothetical protein PAXRUDRAFT_282116 [Paxillus rubicundulus Ve08.2h10]
MPHQTCQKSEQSCSYHLSEAIPFDSVLFFDSLVAQIPIHILYGETKPGGGAGHVVCRPCRLIHRIHNVGLEILICRPAAQ